MQLITPPSYLRAVSALVFNMVQVPQVGPNKRFLTADILRNYEAAHDVHAAGST